MKYLGGKSQIAIQIGRFINTVRKDRQPYWEPFVGGGWVLKEIRGAPIYASDVKYELIEMWKALQDGWVPPDVVSEELYAEAKNGNVDPALTAFIGFGCSWGGKWFGGYARDGRGRNYALGTKNSLLRKIHKMDDDITFFCADFMTTPPPEENMVIYCDPPYANTTRYSMSFDNDAFWNRCRWLVENGHTVVVSEYVAPKDFVCVLEISTKTNLHHLKRVERLFMRCGQEMYCIYNQLGLSIATKPPISHPDLR